MKPLLPAIPAFFSITSVRFLQVFALAAIMAGVSACGSFPVRDGVDENAPTTARSPEGKAVSSTAKSPEADADATSDPLEGLNRVMYSFNDKFYRYLLDPVARGYRWLLPDFMRRGVSNFFGNLHDPSIMINSALQGKLLPAVSDLGRFIVNTTVGIAGLFDVASHIGLDKHDEDFGQTLAVWGVGDGPYLVLPILGPSNLRDTVGLVPDLEMNPVTHMKERNASYGLLVLETVNRKSQLLDASDILEQAGGQDPYVFVREAYRQRRRSLAYDGNPPAPPPDPSLFEDDTPAPKPGQPAPASSPGAK